MKNYHTLINVMVVSTLIITACAESIEQTTIPRKEIIRDNREILTKAIDEQLTKGVSSTDIEDYLVYRLNISLDNVKDIARFDIDSETYIFIVNLINGEWYIFSGDYSSVPVIARGEEPLHLNGQLSRHGEMWLQTIHDRINENKNGHSDKALNNQTNWIRTKYLATLHQTNKHYQRTDTNDSFLILDTLINEYCAALVQTRWDQGSPWNHSMPKMRYGNNRCLAGCTVIAIAQLLYYTHYAFGFPNDIYENASCDDYYDQGPSYNFNFSNQSTTCWDNMSLSYDWSTFSDPYMPALCALIAHRSHTEYHVKFPEAYLMDDSYGETSTDTIPGSLNLFSLNGVTKTIFSRDSVINELLHARPVLCFGADTNAYGHAFLIDGYRWLKVKETENVLDENNEVIDTIVNIYDEFYWHINTGDLSPAHQFWASINYYYYPSQRHMFIGWRQPNS